MSSTPSAPATSVLDPVMAAARAAAYPSFASVEEERQYRKEQLAAGFRIFGRLGFSEGVAGHITVRDPEFPDSFWVNAFGQHFSSIKASDLLRVDHDGNVVEGDKPVNRAAFVIHSKVHQARPDVLAAAHSHSPYGKSLASLGVPLDPITQDACAFFEDHGIYGDYTGVVGEEEEGEQIGRALGSYKAVILQNHGLLTVADTVAAAVWWFVTMERSCQAQLLAMAAGTPRLINREVALQTREQVGTPIAGWFQAQPLYQQILASDPDLVD